MKQTAVEFLESRLIYDSESNCYFIHVGDLKKAIDQSKEMEKKQMIEFADEFYQINAMNSGAKIDSNQYFEEKFG